MRVLLVVYDNDSFIHWFPQGTAYIAAALRVAGHSVSIWSQDFHHYPDEALTAYLDANEFDVVGIGLIAGYYQYQRLIGLSRAVNSARKRPIFVLGGIGPTPEPEFFMRKSEADYVVLGEGEETVVELFDALANKTAVDKIAGIAYRDGDKIKVTPRRPLIADLSKIHYPAYDLFPIEHYRMLRLFRMTNSDFAMPVLSGRGCTFQCTFCYRMDEGFRPRDPEDFLEEVAMLQKDYGITYILFSDELLMSSKQRTIEICEAILKRNMNIKWSCNGRLNYATPEVLGLMRKSGCMFINYGIEAFDNEVLKLMRKGLNVSQIVTGIENTLAADIAPGLNMLFGNVGDNRETLHKATDFLLKYDDLSQMRTIRPVTPYPGSPLYYKAIELGHLKDCEDFYDHKHINSDLVSVNFTELSDHDFHLSLLEANSELVRNYYTKTLDRQLGTMRHLYEECDASFRGYRQN